MESNSDFISGSKIKDESTIYHIIPLKKIKMRLITLLLLSPIL